VVGAIAGDIIGSVYERLRIKTKEFPLFSEAGRFTDDSVLTLAVALAILEGRSYLETIREVGRRYPSAGYGGTFFEWLFSDDPRPYNSWGNGSAMRVSPVGFAFDTIEDVLDQAARSASVSHDHPEGVKGAQATALAVFLARTGADKQSIRREIAGRVGYDMARTDVRIRPSYRFDDSCQGTVPEAIIAFLDSVSYEDAVRNAVSLGGDSDTLACIAGGIAEAYYGSVTPAVVEEVRSRLPEDLWSIVERFRRRFPPGKVGSTS